MTTMKPHNLVKNLGVFFGGCLVALAVLEVLLRVYNPLEIRFRPDRIVLPVHKRYIFDNTEKFPTKLARTTITPKIPWASGAPRLPGISGTT